MPFHIVQIAENGKPTLFVVPAPWVKDNFVFWPQSGGKQLITDEHSQPEGNWKKKRCITKRLKIDTLAIANDIVDKMMKESDSDDHSHFESTAGPKLTKIKSQNVQNQPQVIAQEPSALVGIDSKVN